MTDTKERALDVIAQWLAEDWDDIGPASGPHKQGARILIRRLAAAGFKVVAREPTGEMCQQAMEKACVSENKGIEFAPYVAWQAMFDAVP